MCKKAHRREDLILPCTVFGIHLLLGNMWNGAAYLTSLLVATQKSLYLGATPVCAWLGAATVLHTV